MKYPDYERAFSAARLKKYLTACGGDTAKALILYRQNVKLCQKFYGMLNIFEVILRNAINEHYKAYFNDSDWIRSQLAPGRMLSQHPISFHEETFQTWWPEPFENLSSKNHRTRFWNASTNYKSLVAIIRRLKRNHLDCRLLLPDDLQNGLGLLISQNTPGSGCRGVRPEGRRTGDS